jgi:hypothetical protein
MITIFAAARAAMVATGQQLPIPVDVDDDELDRRFWNEVEGCMRVAEERLDHC